MGDKSGIWRFYRRVWKNIFYERRDKEREGGFLERWEGEVIFFLKFFEGVEENSKFYGEMYFWVMGWGDFWVEWEKGYDMEYSLMECFL